LRGNSQLLPPRSGGGDPGEVLPKEGGDCAEHNMIPGCVTLSGSSQFTFALCFEFRVFCCVLARACLGKSSCIYTGKEIEKKSPKLKKKEKESGVSHVHLIVGQI
jgi:hypothetical protein